MEEGWDAVNLARVAALVDGRALEALPPSAFTTRSARGRAAPAEDDAALDGDASLEGDTAVDGGGDEMRA
jgi:hypothetical protein